MTETSLCISGRPARMERAKDHTGRAAPSRLILGRARCDTRKGQGSGLCRVFLVTIILMFPISPIGG